MCWPATRCLRSGPPQRLRDDRELVRARIDAADETTRVKLQILSLLKRRGIARPQGCGGAWSKRFLAWLRRIYDEHGRALLVERGC